MTVTPEMEALLPKKAATTTRLPFTLIRTGPQPRLRLGAGVKRRDFLKILGATSATTAVVGCSSEKVGKLIPYVTSPDNTVPGVSQYYATTCRECASACGVMAEVRDGRPIKLEGNPDHPHSRGAICATGLSAVQGLYNPDRYRSPMMREGNALKPTTWEKAYELLATKLGEEQGQAKAPCSSTSTMRAPSRASSISGCQRRACPRT
jgi:molybdopterin-containing oxidoreductase family iron-sulfur binding subunit